jgi:hypothetical protein
MRYNARMSSRDLPPISCRLGRLQRAAVVAFARKQGMSTSGLIKASLRAFIGAELGVDQPVNAVARTAPTLRPITPVMALPTRVANRPAMATGVAARTPTPKVGKFCDYGASCWGTRDDSRAIEQ